VAHRPGLPPLPLLLLLAPLAAVPAAGQRGIEQAVWIAYRCNQENRCIRGSAFHVGDGIFYTNAHVARERQGYGALTLGRGVALREQLGAAAILCLNQRALTGETASPYDIAKVRVNRPPTLPALTTVVRGLVPGMRLTIIGYPGRSWTPVVATALIEEIEAFDTFALRLTSGDAGPGSSGSPVLNGQQEVVGVLYGYDPVSQLLFATTLRFADRVCTPR